MRHYPPRAPRHPNGHGRSQRDMAAHMRFAKAVKQRDGYQCQGCGSTTDLRACHLTPLHMGGSNDPSNGQTRCRDCDKRTDPYAR